MDRFIYIAMSGAQQLLQQQAVTAHNLANASTTGYKAETTAFRVAPVVGPGAATRAYALDTTTGADLSAGALQPTGRDLDVAIEGDGFLTVQGQDGTEAYTRAGSLALDADGQLTTRTGQPNVRDDDVIDEPAFEAQAQTSISIRSFCTSAPAVRNSPPAGTVPDVQRSRRS